MLPILIIVALTLLFVIVFMIRGSKSLKEVEASVREELRHGREETRNAGKELREEVSSGLKSTNELLSGTLDSIGKVQKERLETMAKQLKELTESNHATLDRIRNTIDSRVKELQESNDKKLEQMRKTVDEKLHSTLEKRLGESFKLVSDRLEAVHKGLGEMQTLATGVGDLKRVLTNVKVRGTWAEVQLGAILEQILNPGQYDKNVQVKENSQERVEYAVRLPGPKDDPEACIWLPIDSKFPQEDYSRLQAAAEESDPDTVQSAMDSLARTVKSAAKDIYDKYVNPPFTTDFGIMFLATEGLYAEILRQPAVVAELQNRYRVVVAGPTTIAALLSSLHMGFQTLAIEQQAVEVWKVLGAVKTEFRKFGEVLEKIKKQLHSTVRTVESTDVRRRAMERALRTVEQIPNSESSKMIQFPTAIEDIEPDNQEDTIR